MRASLHVVALVPLLMIVGAACGDDDPGAGGGGAATASTASTSSAASTSSSGNPTAGGGGDGGDGPGAGGGGSDAGGGGAGGGGGGGGGGGDACCSSTPPEPAETVAAATPIATSGTRLRARWLDGGGNARVFQGFRDQDLALDCALGVAADGATRCLPTDVGYASYYRDASCTERVYVRSGCAEAIPPYASIFTADDPETTCTRHGRFTFVEIVDEAPLEQTTVYYENGPGTCLPFEVAAGSVHALGAELPAETLALATLDTEAAPGQLDLRAWTTADGASVAAPPIDAAYGPCGVDDYDDLRCAPHQPHVGFEAFTDAACEMQDPDVWVDRGPSCDPPTALKQFAPGGCGATYHEVEPASAPYVREDGTCTPGDEVTAYAIGAEIPRSTFATLDHVGVGTGRLRATQIELGGAPVAQHGSLWDTELQATCLPQQVGDAFRCVPLDAWTVYDVAYEDAACTVPIAANFVDVECATARFMALKSSEPGCDQGPIVEVYEKGEELDLTVAHLIEDGTCNAVDVPAGFVLNALVPLDLLEMTPVVD